MKSIRFLSLLLLLNLFAAGGYAADQPVKKEIDFMFLLFLEF